MNYFWNPATPTNNIKVSDTQDNIDVTPLVPIQNKLERCSLIHDPENSIQLYLVTNLQPVILNDGDIDYINSQGREHIDLHYVGMLRSKPIQKNKARPSRRYS